jgi:hypothetical protein
MSIWLAVIIVRPYGWGIGIVWLLIGLAVYYVYRKSHGMSLTRPYTAPEHRDTHDGGPMTGRDDHFDGSRD